MDCAIRPELTAPHQMNPNFTMRELVFPLFLDQDVHRLLDFGSGYTCKDAVYASQLGLSVDVVDLPWNIQRMNLPLLGTQGITVYSQIPRSTYYDAALLNYVLNVIPNPEDRNEVLSNVVASIKEGGFLVVTVPRRRITGIPYDDGFLQGKRKLTFQKEFEEKELTDLLLKSGLYVESFFRRSSLTIVARKEVAMEI